MPSAIFTIDNPLHQQFPFHYSLINYIFKNSKVVNKEKLAFCCKLFHDQYPYDKIIKELYVSPLYFDHKNNNDEGVIRCSIIRYLSEHGNKIWVKELFYFFCKTELNSISTVISRCTVKTLQVYFKISFKDFYLLTEAKTIKILCISEVIDDQGNGVPIEYIIASVPNANKITIANSNVISKTSNHLILLNHKTKIQELNLRGINTKLLNVSKFYRFLRKNASSRAIIWIQFSRDLSFQKKENFSNALEKKFKKWIPSKNRPIISFFNE